MLTIPQLIVANQHRREICKITPSREAKAARSHPGSSAMNAALHMSKPTSSSALASFRSSVSKPSTNQQLTEKFAHFGSHLTSS
jgi:hypothetical protein